MNSRPRPGPPDTTASSRTSPTGRGRKPPPPGPGRGGGRAMGISGRDSTTARVAVGRAPAGSATCTDCVPPGPRMMGPLGCAPGARPATRGGGGGAGLAATLWTPAGTLETWLCWAGFTGSGRVAGAAVGGGTGAGATAGGSALGSGSTGRAGACATGAATGAARAGAGSGGRTGSGRISTGGGGGGSGGRASTAGATGGGRGSGCSPSGWPSGPSVSAFLRRNTTPLADGLGAAAFGTRSPRNFSVTAKAWSSSNDEEWLLTSYSCVLSQSTISLLERPRSFASSYTRFFAIVSLACPVGGPGEATQVPASLVCPYSHRQAIQPSSRS